MLNKWILTTKRSDGLQSSIDWQVGKGLVALQHAHVWGLSPDRRSDLFGKSIVKFSENLKLLSIFRISVCLLLVSLFLFRQENFCDRGIAIAQVFYIANPTLQRG